MMSIIEPALEILLLLVKRIDRSLLIVKLKLEECDQFLVANWLLGVGPGSETIIHDFANSAYPNQYTKRVQQFFDLPYRLLVGFKDVLRTVCVAVRP